MARWTAAKGPALFAYSTNYMIDVEHGIIMDVEAMPGFRADEVDSTRTLLERIEVNHDITPKQLMGDTAYGAANLLGYLVEEKGIEPHVPLWEKSNRTDGTYANADFIWVAADNEYRCSQNKILHTTGHITKANTVLYRARNLECAVCPNKHKCCPNTPHRKIARSLHENARERVRHINQSATYRNKTFHERKKVEMLFAHMKRNLKLDRLRLRGLKGASDEFLLTAKAQNLRKLAILCGQPPPVRGSITPV